MGGRTTGVARRWRAVTRDGSAISRRLAALAGVLVIVVSTLVVQLASAHQSPVGCTGSALGVQIVSDRQVIRPGQTVTYSVFVSNVVGAPAVACDVTNATVTGIRPDGSTVVIATGQNFPSGTPSTFVGTFTYTLPANSVANTITASATVAGTSHTAGGDVPGSGSNAIAVPVTRPATTLTKTASASSVRTGGTVTYTFTETNTGNANIGSVVVTDSKCAPLVRGADAPGNNDAILAPGEAFTFTCTTALTTPDPGSVPPSVSDVATASGTDLDDLQPAPGETSNVVIVGLRNPATLLTKTRTGPATVAPGTPVTYTYTEQNTGTDPISNVVLTDDRCAPVTRGPDNPGNNDAILSPGETFTYTCTTTFTTSGPVTNTVTATGTDTIDGLPAPLETAQATVTVVRPTPTITTTASATGTTPGATVTDTALIAGGSNPGGTVTFRLYSNATCTALVTSSTTPVTATGPTTGTATSTPFVITAAGTYYFTAEYSGDIANGPAGPTGCLDAGEQATLNQTTPALTTTATPAAATVGGTIHDVANITGAFNPTGTVTFILFSDAACTTQVFTSTNPVTTTGTAAVPSTLGTARSDDFLVTAPGTYHWRAVYNGDANNAATTLSSCTDPAEAVTVAPARPAITTQASASVPVGSVIRDTAMVTGGFNPTGNVSFDLFGPTDPTCAGPPIFNSMGSVIGGNATSGGFVTTSPGTYRFRATYLGDVNNAPAGPSGCADPAEQVVVTQAAPLLTTVASPAVPLGNPIRDTANLSGGISPTGTVSFALFGPADPTCTAAPVFVSPNRPVVGTSATSADFVPTAQGTYRWQATYNGDANNAAVGPTACGDPLEQVVVGQAAPAIATQASPPVAMGAGTISDRATLTGAVAPTGTVTFRVFKDDPTCAAASQVFTSTNPVVTATGVAVSDAFTPTGPGTYRFVATYNGDPNNAAVGPTPCTAAGESVVVSPASLTLVTHATTGVPVGGVVSDVATLSGGIAPTGTITFRLYGPDDATCTGAVVATSTRTVTGNGDYTSDPFTTSAAGVYRFVATYSGDANNAAVGPTSCGDPLEATPVTKVTPTLVTDASDGVQVGGAVTDTATLSGGSNPTGTITFRLYGPADPTCTGTPVFVSTRTANGNGNYVSDPFTISGPGIYRFVAAYSGDANNNPSPPTACGDPNETVGGGVSASGTLTTTASGPVSLGNTISDTAVLGGAFLPTGTITFRVYGPDDTTCTGAVAFTSVSNVSGNGSYLSGPFTPTAPGTYRFVATYSGDVNNVAIATACADPAEAVTVAPLPTIAIDKTAAPESRPVPGGIFTFNVVVTNTSSVPLTIRALVDDIYGDVTVIPGSTCNTAIGTVLAPSPGPGNTYACHFPGEFRGPGGASQTDTVAVRATDNRGNTVRAQDNAIVRITPVIPTITTTKTPSPVSLPEPGGAFTFNYSVTNTGPEAVTVTSIVDDVYGDLNGRGTCAVGARLAPNGGTYSCSFTGNFFGDAGAKQTDTITTTAIDDHGQTVVSKTNATVTITNVPPTIRITKSPEPVSRPEPGGSFRFTVVVTNTSFEPITITSLVDDIYGDLNGRGSCAIGATLAANGGTYRCAFDGQFTGRAGDRQTDTVTVIAIDNDRSTVTDRASATVFLTPLPPPPPATPPPATPPPPPPTTPPVLIPVQVPPLQLPPVQVQQPLVRTGTDSMGMTRVAFMLVLLGMLLVLAARRFGGGGPRPAPVPTGPAGGPPGSGPRSGSAFGATSWFGAAPSRPWSARLAGGTGPVPAADDAPPASAEAPASGAAGGWFQPARPPDPGPGSILGHALGMGADPARAADGAAHELDLVAPYPLHTAPLPAAAPPAPAPSVTADDVLVPRVVVVRATGGLDAVAIEAAADMRMPVRPEDAAAPRRRGPRRFGR